MVRKPNSTFLHTASKFGGGVLLGLGAFGLAWLLFFQHVSMPTSPRWTIASATTTPDAAAIQTPALQSAGITLSSTSQPAVLGQAQATQLANQQQPDAAAHAKKIEAHYGLMNDPASQGSQTLHNLPVWMIWYQNVPQQPNDVAVDVQPAHDLYVFIDAKTGRNVLSIWV